MSKITLQTEGDTHVVVTRRFAAPPEAVYRAHTDPKLVQKWMLGPEGWTMPVCISEAKARDSTSRANIWNLSLIADSFMWSACTCQVLRPTTMLKRDLMLTVRAH